MRLQAPDDGSSGIRYRLRLMDGFRLHRDGTPVQLPWSGQRLVALLGVVGLRSRTAAAGTLWPEVNEEHARGSLRTALWRLHRRWPDLVSVEGHQLELTPHVHVDIRAISARAARLLDVEPETVREDLSVRSLAGSELLPGWCDDWVVFETRAAPAAAHARAGGDGSAASGSAPLCRGSRRGARRSADGTAARERPSHGDRGSPRGGQRGGGGQTVRALPCAVAHRASDRALRSAHRTGQLPPADRRAGDIGSYVVNRGRSSASVARRCDRAPGRSASSDPVRRASRWSQNAAASSA